MPVYEYKCQKCGEKFDVYRPMNDSDNEMKCPKCGAEKPKRQFSFYSPKNITAGGSCSPFKSA